MALAPPTSMPIDASSEYLPPYESSQRSAMAIGYTPALASDVTRRSTLSERVSPSSMVLAYSTAPRSTGRNVALLSVSWTFSAKCSPSFLTCSVRRKRSPGLGRPGAASKPSTTMSGRSSLGRSYGAGVSVGSADGVVDGRGVHVGGNDGKRVAVADAAGVTVGAGHVGVALGGGGCCGAAVAARTTSVGPAAGSVGGSGWAPAPAAHHGARPRPSPRPRPSATWRRPRAASAGRASASVVRTAWIAVAGAPLGSAAVGATREDAGHSGRSFTRGPPWG